MLKRLLAGIFCVIFLISCGDNTSTTPIPTLASEATLPTIPINTTTTNPTDIPPTATPAIPLAAQVNGEPILLVDYEREVSRYEQGLIDLGIDPATTNTNYQEDVLNNLIEQVIIAYFAEERGLIVSQERVAQRLEETKQEANGDENFQAWLNVNLFTEEEYKDIVTNELLTQAVVQLVTINVPYAVPQVHARFIQVADRELANTLLTTLQNDASQFADLADIYSLNKHTVGGDLDFFVQGTLLVPAIDELAFSLNEGEIGMVTVSTNDGEHYYIVQTIEKVAQRDLTPQQRSAMLRETFENWLNQQKDEATIEILINTES